MHQCGSSLALGVVEVVTRVVLRAPLLSPAEYGPATLKEAVKVSWKARSSPVSRQLTSSPAAES